MKYRILTFLIFCVPFLMCAQEPISSDYVEMGGFADKENLPVSIAFPTMANLERSQPTLNQAAVNNVFIVQVGNDNNVNSNIASRDAAVDIVQSGNDNYITMDIEAPRVRGQVVQNGNNNEVFDFSFSPEQPVQFDFSQTGNNHHIESFGSNSIGNKLKVEQTGESKTVIIRNFQ